MDNDFVLNKYSIEELEDIISNNELTNEDWVCISSYQKLTEAFIEKYADRVYWNAISEYQYLTEYLIEKYSDRVNWNHIIRHMKLSESFIEKYMDILDWWNIIVYQELSYEFMERHLYKYSLSIDYGVNRERLFKLQAKYKDKYFIDELEYELNHKIHI